MYRTIGQYKADFGASENGRVIIKDGVVTVSQDMKGCDPNADFEALVYGRREIDILKDHLYIKTGKPTDIGPMEYEDAADELNCAKALKCEELAAARYAAEVAGTSVNGVHIRTDRESQALITGAALQVLDNPEYTCQWKTETGVFVTLDASTILSVARAVRAHVQGCFDREAAVGERIDAAKTKEELEAITWESVS